MSDIRNALKELSSVHNKYQIHGHYLASHAVRANWSSELPRSSELDILYNEYDPVGVRIETGLTPLKMFEANLLEKAQLGYRWINVGGEVELNSEWPQQRLIIMDDVGGGKPIIADTDVESTPVLASYDAVEPFLIADSLADFILALARLVDIVYGEFNIFDLSDDESVSGAFLTRLNDEISPILGQDNIARFVDYFYG